MKRSGLLFLCFLIVCANYAFARQGADGLNEQQRLGRQLVAQACGVCHLPPARHARTYGPLLNKAAGGGGDAVVGGYNLDGAPRMAAVKHFLRPTEIDAIIAYLRTVPVPAPSPESR